MVRTATLTPKRWFNETHKIVSVVMLACLLSEVYAAQKTQFSGDIKTNESYVKALTDDQTVDHSDSNSAVHRNKRKSGTDEHPMDTHDKKTTLNDQTTVPDNRNKEETNRLIDEDRSTVDEESKIADTSNPTPDNTNGTTDLSNSASDITSETSTRHTDNMGLGAGSPPSTTEENNSHSNMHSQNQAAADRKRASIARLHERIRNLRVSRERTAPLTPSDEDGNATETRIVAHVGALSVLAIDDAKQSMVSSSYVYFQWWDPALGWNLSDHYGAREVEMPADSVWMPIIYFLNSLDDKHILSTLDTVFISYTGVVSAHRLMIFETSCNMDLDFYPYDTQNCPLAFFLPSSVGLRLDVELMQIPRALLTTVSYGSQWELLNATKGLPDSKYTSVLLTVRRKTTFYTVSLVLPLVLTSYMNTLVFLLPLQSGEKVSFLVTLFVSTSFFFAFFNDAMPKGLDSVPVVMRLLIGVIVESLLVLMATLFVMRRDMTSRDVTSSMSSDVRNDGPLESARRREPKELFGNTADATPNGNNKGLNNYDLYERTSEELVSKSRLSGIQHCLNLNRLDLAFFVLSVVAITVFHVVLYVNTFLRN